MQISKKVHRRAAKYAEEAQREEMIEASFDQKLSAKAFESSLFFLKRKKRTLRMPTTLLNQVYPAYPATCDPGYLVPIEASDASPPLFSLRFLCVLCGSAVNLFTNLHPSSPFII
jgi:hypothetical protein